jgi:hypothetical protein
LAAWPIGAIPRRPSQSQVADAVGYCLPRLAHPSSNSNLRGVELPSVAFFNNKGGVGKTTLSCNMAAYLAKSRGLRVLVIDCDPQCNATQLLLKDEVWEELYGNRRESSNRTLLKALRHIRAGDSAVDLDLHIEHSERFGCDVLAGHPNLSILEDTLSLSWGEFRQGTPGGARRSMWALTVTGSGRGVGHRPSRHGRLWADSADCRQSGSPAERRVSSPRCDKRPAGPCGQRAGRHRSGPAARGGDLAARRPGLVRRAGIGEIGAGVVAARSSGSTEHGRRRSSV